MRSINCLLVVGLDRSARAAKNTPQPNRTAVVVEVSVQIPTLPKIAAVPNIELQEPPEMRTLTARQQVDPIDETEADDAA